MMINIKILQKKFKTNISSGKENKHKNKDQIFNKFNFNEFLVFNKKFCNIFIYRGKKSYAIKTYNFFLENLKNKLKEDPILTLFIIIKKIVPFFLISQKRYYNKLVSIPIFAKLNKKIRYILNWLVRQLRNRSNIYGIKKEDVLNLLLETYEDKGSALKLKQEFFNLALELKYNLKKNYFFKKILKKWENEEKEKNLQYKDKVILLRAMTETQIDNIKKIEKGRRLYKFYLDSMKKNNLKKFLVK